MKTRTKIYSKHNKYGNVLKEGTRRPAPLPITKYPAVVDSEYMSGGRNPTSYPVPKETL